ncbi:MAG TPA: hypothetical protein VHD56_15515 [Tepidisphaeraceae bacterium]|nr:hypothetical protein [Tepidisphaeraceae bacterium]
MHSPDLRANNRSADDSLSTSALSKIEWLLYPSTDPRRVKFSSMSLLDNEFARRTNGRIVWRNDPLRVSWLVTQLVSADHHALHCRFECRAAVAVSPADRQMFAETFLPGRESVAVEQVREHLLPAIQQCLAELALKQTAGEGFDQPTREIWLSALRKAADASAFACGIELLPPFSLDIQSPTLRQQQLHQVSTARQSEQLQQTAEILKQFQSLRQSAPELSAGKLLDRIAPAQQSHVLQSLLMAAEQKSVQSQLWAVAGDVLVKVDPRIIPPKLDLYPLPTELGPLRSVQTSDLKTNKILLIGAQRGVIIFSPNNPAQAVLFRHDTLQSQLGFNQVVCDGNNRIWASHSEAGIVGWSLDQPNAPTIIFDEDSPKHLHLLDDRRLIYATGNRVVIRDGSMRTELDSTGDSPFIAIEPADGKIVLIHQEGRVAIIDRNTHQLLETRNRGATLSAAGTMPWQGDIRLLLATESGPIDCIGLDDSIVTQYASAHKALKMVCATEDLIVAVSGDRQRIIVWHSYDGQRPIGEIHMLSRTRHRVADVQFD